LSNVSNGVSKLSGTAPDSVAGANSIKLYVSDNFGAKDSLIFNLEVEVRVAPVITANATETGTVGQIFSMNIEVSDDNLTDEVVLYVSEKPTWLSFVNAGENMYKLHGNPTMAGTYQVVMQATDGYLTSDFTVDVTISENPDNAPVISSSPISVATAGSDYVYNITATDADGDYLYFIGSQIPSWLNIQDNLDGTAVLFGSPEEGNIGVHEVVIGVTDGKNITKQGFNIEVNPAAKKMGEISVYPNPAVDKLIVDKLIDNGSLWMAVDYAHKKNIDIDNDVKKNMIKAVILSKYVGTSNYSSNVYVGDKNGTNFKGKIDSSSFCIKDTCSCIANYCSCTSAVFFNWRKCLY